MELKKYRRIAGLTQQQLADKAGVDKTIVSRLERGERRSASYETTVRLARALNLEPDELVHVDFTVPMSRPPMARSRAESNDAAN